MMNLVTTSPMTANPVMRSPITASMVTLNLAMLNPDTDLVKMNPVMMNPLIMNLEMMINPRTKNLMIQDHKRVFSKWKAIFNNHIICSIFKHFC